MSASSSSRLLAMQTELTDSYKALLSQTQVAKTRLDGLKTDNQKLREETLSMHERRRAALAAGRRASGLEEDRRASEVLATRLKSARNKLDAMRQLEKHQLLKESNEVRHLLVACEREARELLHPPAAAPSDVPERPRRLARSIRSLQSQIDALRSRVSASKEAWRSVEERLEEELQDRNQTQQEHIKNNENIDADETEKRDEDWLLGDFDVVRAFRGP